MLISARSNLGRIFCVDYFTVIKRRQFQFNLPERRMRNEWEHYLQDDARNRRRQKSSSTKTVR